jgi:hypothetical protein
MYIDDPRARLSILPRAAARRFVSVSSTPSTARSLGVTPCAQCGFYRPRTNGSLSTESFGPQTLKNIAAVIERVRLASLLLIRQLCYGDDVTGAAAALGCGFYEETDEPR